MRVSSSLVGTDAGGAAVASGKMLTTLRAPSSAGSGQLACMKARRPRLLCVQAYPAGFNRTGRRHVESAGVVPWCPRVERVPRARPQRCGAS